MVLALGCGSKDADDSAIETTDATSATGSSEPSGSATDDCTPNPTDPTQYVVVGFWNNDPTCSGEPMITNAFPVAQGAPCYCWPGNSGENSADTFVCDPTTNSFTYTQYNSLTCGVDDDTPTVKTSYTDRCEQDIPENLYAQIIDYGACGS
jgi:hypothetical protein